MQYGDQIQQQEALPPAEQDYPQEMAGYYPGDMWAGKGPSDQAAQVRKALFDCKLPSEEDFEKWYPTLQAAIDIVARVPGYDSAIFYELNRQMEDLVDRANSQGRRRIVASKMQKFIFRLRSLVPKGDVPIAGVTGVTAMITTNTNTKQEVRYPQQQQGSFLDMIPGPWRKK